MDFSISDQGSLILIQPVSDRAKQFTDENIHTESWQWLGGAFAVEPRFAQVLVNELPELGFTIGEQ